MKTFFEEKMNESMKFPDDKEAEEEEEEEAEFQEFREFCKTELVEFIDLFCGRDIKSLETDFDDISIRLANQRDIKPATGTPDLNTDSVEIEPRMESVKSKYLGFLHLLDEKGLPFVNVEENVKKGQVLGLVETINILNEIKSTVDGTLIQVLEDNGKPVEYGQQLFVIEVQ